MGNSYDNITDYSDFINTAEILDKLNLCISSGGAPLGGAVSVGIYDQTSIDNLSKAIATGISKRKDVTYQQSLLNGFNAVKNSVNSQTNTLIIGFEKHNKELMKKEEEAFNPIKIFMNSFAKNYPNISKMATLVSQFATFEYEQQMKWMDWYRQINESGVYLSGGMDSLTEKANKTGLKLDEMVKLYTKHSDVVADMGGLFGNGTEAFAKLIGLTKDTGKNLGMIPNQTAEITANFAKDYAWLYSQQADGVEELSIRTNQYLMHLDKLSKATGKSWQTIEKETEAREKEFRIQLWLSNDENKKKKQIWDQIGIPKEVQEALMFGLPNSKSAMFQANDPELYALLQRGASLEELKAHAMKRANLTNEEYQRWQENNLGIMGEEWNSLMMGHTFVERNLQKMDLEQNNKDNNEESNAKTLSDLMGIQEKLNGVLNGFTQTLKISDENLSTYVSELKTVTNKISEYVNNITDFANQHPYVSAIGTSLISGIGLAFGNSLTKFFGKGFASLFSLNGIGMSKLLYGLGGGVSIALLMYHGFPILSEMIAKDYYKYGERGKQKEKSISSMSKEELGKYNQWLHDTGKWEGFAKGYTIDKGLVWDSKKDVDYNKLIEQFRTAQKVLPDKYAIKENEKNTNDKLNQINQINSKEINQEMMHQNNSKEINQEMMQQKNNDEKEKLNQNERMKEREMVLQEQQRQKEALEQKLKDVEQDNTKNSLECLRSIDTKLNILMNIDGKYDDIKNIANTLRINNELEKINDNTY